MSELGAKVLRMREQRQMTQRELAQASGLTPSYVSKIESGSLQSGPSTAAIVSLAHGLGVDELCLLEAAGRLPSPFERLARDPEAARFFRRAVERVRDPEGWRRLEAALDSPDPVGEARG
jgi:transcriptional regulator with XRE-family HTH domain